MKSQPLLVRVKTPTRWEYLTDEWRASPNLAKAALFRNTIHCFYGLRQFLREGVGCIRWEIRLGDFADGDWRGLGNVHLAGGGAVIETLVLNFCQISQEAREWLRVKPEEEENR